MIGVVSVVSVAALVWAARRPASNPPASSADCCSAESDSWRDPVYRRWKPHVTTYRSAQAECWNESKQAALLHDYSKPADRRCTLGRMHAYKRKAWEACRRECRKAREGTEEVEVIDDGFDTVVGRGSLWLRIAADGPDYVVTDNRDGVELGRFDSYQAAEESARGYFTVPF